MKTITQFALTGLAAALFATGSALAGEGEWRTVDNHHGSVSYYYVPGSTQRTVTVGYFNGNTGKGLGGASNASKQGQGAFRQVSTPHGTINYYAPAE